MARVGGTGSSRWAAWTAAAALLVAPLAGCGGKAGSVALCPLGQRHLLLDARLAVYGGNLQSFSVPSAPFTVAPRTRVFLTVSQPPSLPAKSGVEVYLLGGASTPNLTSDAAGNPRSDDPGIRMATSGGWRQAALAPGPHRLYAWSDPEVQVLSCPA